MMTAVQIAEYLANKSGLKFPDSIPRIMAMTYLAQCWHIVDHKSKLYADEIYAWYWGPVVPAVFNKKILRTKIRICPTYRIK